MDWLVGVKVNVYTEHQDLQYFNTKDNLNSGQASWYLCMCEFIYHTHYRIGFKMDKPDGLSRRSEEQKSGKDINFFNQEQLLDLENDEVAEEQYAEDVEVEGFYVVTCEKKNGLCVVQQEYR